MRETAAAAEKSPVGARGAYLSRLLLVRALIHLIHLLGEVGKVRDDEFPLKSICQQHDVVTHTPRGRRGRGGEVKNRRVPGF